MKAEAKRRRLADATTRPHGTEARFTQTHWSLVLGAADQGAPGAREALEQLCRKYWFPLYAFLRRQGRTPEDAKDLTQGFLAQLLAKDRLQQAQPAKGKFRSFLLAGLANHVHNERDRERAIKRGGGHEPVAIDLLAAEDQLAAVSAQGQDAASLFERRWASALLEQVLQSLKARHQAAGKADLFATLLPFLTGDAPHGGTAAAAAKLGLGEEAVRKAVSRLRRDFRELLRQEIALTVGHPSEVDDEIRHLFGAVQRV